MTLGAIETALRKAALAYPESTEDHPWGHSAFKVRGKTFLFLNSEDGTLSLSLKLPISRDFALDAFDWTEPTGYGLGKSGWVTAAPAADADIDLLLGWLDESWRAVAPKKLSASHPA